MSLPNLSSTRQKVGIRDGNWPIAKLLGTVVTLDLQLIAAGPQHPDTYISFQISIIQMSAMQRMSTVTAGMSKTKSIPSSMVFTRI